MRRVLSYTITTVSEGNTVGEFLRQHNYSRAMISKLKRTPKGIQKNGVDITVKGELIAGDRLQIELLEDVSEKIVATPKALEVLYEDEDLLVINKPADTPIHPSVNQHTYTLANYVMHYCGTQKYTFRCINRLDRDTTGITIVAKHSLSASILGDAIQQREIQRVYIAIVEGEVDEAGRIDLPIGRAPDTIIKRQIDKQKGQRAVTVYRCLKVFERNGKVYSVVQLELETGRTHQIRVHMAAIGHPLIGDFLYNPSSDELSRQALHAVRCVFRHPITAELKCIDAPIPEDMQSFMASH